MNKAATLKQKSRFAYLTWRMARKLRGVLSPVFSFFYFRWFTQDSYGDGFARWYMGLREFFWSYICGYSLYSALHVANIYWGILK